jgi:putative transposase
MEGLEVAGRPRPRRAERPWTATRHPDRVGPVEVRRAKVRDRADVAAEEKIRFTSSILPKWARRTKSLDALLPILYLRMVSTGGFQEVSPPSWARMRPTCLPP